MDSVFAVKLFYVFSGDFFPRHFQIIQHRPDCQQRCDKHQYIADNKIKSVKIGNIQQQQENCQHLRGGFELTDGGDGNAVPLPICAIHSRNAEMVISADNDHGKQNIGPAEFDQ